jgi:hypothetical protein
MNREIASAPAGFFHPDAPAILNHKTVFAYAADYTIVSGPNLLPRQENGSETPRVTLCDIVF